MTTTTSESMSWDDIAKYVHERAALRFHFSMQTEAQDLAQTVLLRLFQRAAKDGPKVLEKPGGIVRTMLNAARSDMARSRYGRAAVDRGEYDDERMEVSDTASESGAETARPDEYLDAQQRTATVFNTDRPGRSQETAERHVRILEQVMVQGQSACAVGRDEGVSQSAVSLIVKEARERLHARGF